MASKKITVYGENTTYKTNGPGINVQVLNKINITGTNNGVGILSFGAAKTKITDFPEFKITNYTHSLWLHDKIGRPVVKVQNGEENITYNSNTDEFTSKIVNQFSVHPSLAVELNDGKTLADVQFFQMLLDSDQNTSKVKVDAVGDLVVASVYMAQDAFSVFKLTAKLVPVQSTDSNYVSCALSNISPSDGNPFFMILNGNGYVDISIPGALTHL